jgi:hypothetical protein
MSAQSPVPKFPKAPGMSQIEIGMSELYFAVIDWVMAQGVPPLHTFPGVWHGQTIDIGDALGVLDVRINAHREEIDAIPAFAMAIGKDDKFPGLIAMLQPLGGVILASPTPGEDEAGLLHHFKSQPVPMPKAAQD